MQDQGVPPTVREACRQLAGLAQAGASRDLSAELQRCLSAVGRHPGDIAAWNDLALLAQRLGHPALAVPLLRYAISVNDSVSVLHGNLGNLLREQGHWRQALDCYRQASRLAPQDADYYLAAAEVCLQNGSHDDELAWLRAGLQHCPDHPRLLVRAGEAEKRGGDSDTALVLFRRARELAPHDGYIHLTLAQTKKFSRCDEDIRRMEQLLQRGDVATPDRVRLCFALGKAYEDLGDYDRSFGYYESGNGLQRSTLDYDPAEDSSLFSSIKDEFDAALFADRPQSGCGSDVPVFIVGMPRSGTTLLEQMLSAHPQVYGAGELSLLAKIVHSIWSRNQPRPGRSYPAAVRDLDRSVFRQAGDYYAATVAGYMERKTGAQRVIDKMPHNFLYIGMIRLLLPQARIIHCRRDPLDTCFSCYKHLFTGQHRYAYDLVELGRYYALYRDLMAHWQRVLPGAVLDVDYEEVVADPSGQLSRVLEFLALPWDAACLAYDQSGRVAHTASSMQVRQPLYRGAIGYWRHYQAHLGPLQEALSWRADGSN